MLKASSANFGLVEAKIVRSAIRRRITRVVRSIPINLICGHLGFMPKLLADEDVQRIRQSGVHAIGFTYCADDGLWLDDVPAPTLALLLCNEKIPLREVKVVDTGFSTGSSSRAGVDTGYRWTL